MLPSLICIEKKQRVRDRWGGERKRRESYNPTPSNSQQAHGAKNTKIDEKQQTFPS